MMHIRVLWDWHLCSDPDPEEEQTNMCPMGCGLNFTDNRIHSSALYYIFASASPAPLSASANDSKVGTMTLGGRLAIWATPGGGGGGLSAGQLPKP